MEIYKMLVMSTGHISKETALLLSNDDAGVVVYPKENYGWFIVVTDWNDEDKKIPEDLQRCLAFAEENNCDWLCLDCDGEIYTELSIYNWSDNKIEQNISVNVLKKLREQGLKKNMEMDEINEFISETRRKKNTISELNKLRKEM